MNKEQSIREAERVWANNITVLNALKRRIRAEAEAEIERELAQRKAAAARAIHYAREQGASKTALREVTTKDHYDFESYITLGEQLSLEDRRAARRVKSLGSSARTSESSP